MNLKLNHDSLFVVMKESDLSIKHLTLDDAERFRELILGTNPELNERLYIAKLLNSEELTDEILNLEIEEQENKDIYE